MRLNRPDAFYHRVGAGGLVGFGESYQAGDWDCDDMPRLIGVFAQHAETPAPFLRVLRLLYRSSRRPRSDQASVTGARRNAQRHYDLSNEFFALFLDKTMTYSSALFETDEAGRPIASAALLTDAQLRKIDGVLDLARVGPETRLLEIGTGWGELALTAARRGALVHTVTVSAKQYDLAGRRVAAAGLADRVSVQLCDYRDIVPRHDGGYDAIVSVEMIEAVDAAHWPVYFATLDRLLTSGGRIVLQAITMPPKRVESLRNRHTWIHKYIFPGGLIPSMRAIEDTCRRYTRLRMREVQAFGAHYAQTLRLWRERLDEHSADLAALGFDETFRRTWRLYLSLSEAGFTGGHLDVRHLILERPA